MDGLSLSRQALTERAGETRNSAARRAGKHECQVRTSDDNSQLIICTVNNQRCIITRAQSGTRDSTSDMALNDE